MKNEIKHGPFAVMAGAPWNVLDSRGCRIAICGGDSNADWEQCGPAIAAVIVEALNEAHRKQLEAERLKTHCCGCDMLRAECVCDVT